MKAKPIASGWIVNPAVDMLLCCGGLVWVLFAVQQFVVAPLHNAAAAQFLTLLTTIGAHACGEAHTTATLFKLYGSEESRQKYSLFSLWLPIAFAALFIAGLFLPGVTGLLLKIYLCWVVQHFTAQTYGIILLYCYKRGYDVDTFDKQSLAALLNSAAAVAIVRQLTDADWMTFNMLGQDLPIFSPLPAWILQLSIYVLQFAACLFAARVCHKALTRGRSLPVPAMLMILTTVATFTAGLDVAGVLWLYVPAFYHATQYLAVTISQQQKSLIGKSDSIAAATVTHYSQLLGAAVILYVGIPFLLSVFGLSFDLAFANVFVILSLHHFLTDSAIWKMRDPAVRLTLLFD